MKFIYKDIEDVLKMANKFVTLFNKEELYNTHVIHILPNGKFLLSFDIKQNNGINSKSK